MRMSHISHTGLFAFFPTIKFFEPSSSTINHLFSAESSGKTHLNTSILTVPQSIGPPNHLEKVRNPSQLAIEFAYSLYRPKSCLLPTCKAIKGRRDTLYSSCFRRPCQTARYLISLAQYSAVKSEGESFTYN